GADTKIVFIANPNNPTGTFVAWPELARFLEQMPLRVLVVLDEAYEEYLPDELRAPATRWLARHASRVVRRTLSKAVGLGGLRVGPDAPPVYERLLRAGIIVRPLAGYGMPEHLRVTVGLPEHNARLLVELERALAKA